MRILAVAALAALLAAVTIASPAAQTRYTFDAHSFTISLPQGFSLVTEASPEPGYKRWTFATDTRADGTRGIMQVGLFEAARMGGSPPIDEFTKTMASTLQAAYTNFSGQVQSLPFLGDSRLVQWSGSLPIPESGVSLPIRGLMVLGVQDGLYFRLDAFDAETMAPQTLPAADLALASFRLMVAPPAR